MEETDQVAELESGPILPTETALNFECELAGLRASRDGVRITLLVHPQEACLPMFLELGLNKRLYVSAVAVGDNEEIAPPPSLIEGIRAVRQAGMLSRSEDFQRFAVAQSYMDERPSPKEREEAATYFIRSWCRVRSRSDIKYDKAAQGRLGELIGEFSQWTRNAFQASLNRSDDLDL
jgi:hypothetical protein